MKLNLGSGKDYRPGWVNVDQMPGSDIQTDILEMPWKWAEDKQFTYVLCSHLLEHIPRGKPLLSLVDELYRVMQPGAMLEVCVPYHDSSEALWRDPTHIGAIPPSFWDYFNPTLETQAHDYGQQARFQLQDTEIYGWRPRLLFNWKVRGLDIASHLREHLPFTARLTGKPWMQRQLLRRLD